MSRSEKYDFGVQNVRNRNVQKRQINEFWCTKCRKQKWLNRKINDFGVENGGNRNVQKRQINDFGVQNV